MHKSQHQLSSSLLPAYLRNFVEIIFACKATEFIHIQSSFQSGRYSSSHNLQLSTGDAILWFFSRSDWASKGLQRHWRNKVNTKGLNSFICGCIHINSLRKSWWSRSLFRAKAKNLSRWRLFLLPKAVKYGTSMKQLSLRGGTTRQSSLFSFGSLLS